MRLCCRFQFRLRSALIVLTIGCVAFAICHRHATYFESPPSVTAGEAIAIHGHFIALTLSSEVEYEIRVEDAGDADEYAHEEIFYARSPFWRICDVDCEIVGLDRPGQYWIRFCAPNLPTKSAKLRVRAR